jgi:Ataxin-3
VIDFCSSKEYLNRLAEGSANVDESGNFSVEVLRSALKIVYDLDLVNVLQEDLVSQYGDITNMEGFIAHKDAHWFAIRKINGKFWNLNSMEKRPLIISSFMLGSEIAGYQKNGCKHNLHSFCRDLCHGLNVLSLDLVTRFSADTVFCVPVLSHQCPLCTSKTQRQRGQPEYWWKEDDLVSGKTNAVNGATDPWRDVGSGMRLDGKSTISNSLLFEGLTEEEMLQMAISASMEPTPTFVKVELTAEPPPGTSGAVRIRFRLPDGRRTDRSFLGSDPVAMVYAYVESVSTGGQGKSVELRAGFPPKDLQPLIEKKIGEVSLANESVQCRLA